jgi:RsiW-degrading membrane proteinase PrsW (M82 family)
LTVSTCPHCGTPAYGGDSRCRNCGWTLTPSLPPAAQSSSASSARPSPAPLASIPPRPGESVWRQANPQQAPLPGGLPVTVPGYPTYAQGQGVPYAPYPPQYQPYPPYAPYGPYPPYIYPPQRRAPGETYALVVSWIVTVIGALSIILSLLILGISALALSDGSNSLSTLGLAVSFGLAPLVGGVTAMVLGIQGILRRPSHTFFMPNYWYLLALTLIALGAGVVLWNLYPSPGSALAVSPLVVMSGVLPALVILALTTQRLGNPSTRRHVLMSLAYGATLAPLLAIILELLATLVIYLAARALGFDVGNALNNTNFSPTNPQELVAQLLDISLTAAVVEETLKPLGAVLIIRRLRTRSEAFLVGLAAGIGFNIVETIGYITQGQGDWINVALERSAAGLLHGVGAGMATLGWWYLINGKGVSLRFIKGFALILYAMAQHAINNGAAVLISLVPEPLRSVLFDTFYLGRLPEQYASLVFLAYGGLILIVLLWVTSALRRIDKRSSLSAGSGAPILATGVAMAQGGSR